MTDRHLQMSQCRRVHNSPEALQAPIALIRRAFAELEGRIDPPSSARAFGPADVSRQNLEMWVLGDPVIAAMVLTPLPQNVLYIGKLAVDPAFRRRGYAGKMLDCAEARAREISATRLQLQSRVELVENHALFEKFGFVVTGKTKHPGYARTTSLSFEKALS